MAVSGNIPRKKSSPLKIKAPATKAKAAPKTVSHPPFADIIKECIAETGDRTGVSRPTIKKFIEERYKMEVTPTVISNINRCIASGAEKGVFALPKGPSGKVKLAPKKSSSDAAKENAKPVKAPAPAKAEKKVTNTKTATKPAPLKAKTSTKTSPPKTKKTTSSTEKPTKKAPKTASAAKKTLTGTTKTKSPKSKTNVKTQKSASTGTKRKSSTTKPASGTKAATKPASTK